MKHTLTLFVTALLLAPLTFCRAADVVIYGSTPGGIACAVRAAREGVDVLLVTHAEHVGGLLSSGLSTMDALYAGKRAPVLSPSVPENVSAGLPRFPKSLSGKPFVESVRVPAPLLGGMSALFRLP